MAWLRDESAVKYGAISGPTATRAAPVSVAMHIIRSGGVSSAKVKASAKTKRPSASVLLISTLRPLRLMRISCGRNASPLIEFSTAGINIRSCKGILLAMIILASPITWAAPPISFFINPIEAPGLIFNPPVSKHTPLPTSVSLGPLVPQVISINRGSRGEARPTAWIIGKFWDIRSFPFTTLI